MTYYTENSTDRRVWGIKMVSKDMGMTWSYHTFGALPSVSQPKTFPMAFAITAHLKVYLALTMFQATQEGHTVITKRYSLS